MADGITNKGQIPGNRAAKVIACSLGLAVNSLKCMKLVEEKKVSSKEAKKLTKTVKENLSILKQGLRHELVIINVVQDNGFPFVKSYEGHNRLDKEARKRVDHVKALKKSEDRESNAEKKKSFPRRESQRGYRQTNRSGGQRREIKCFNCLQFGHVQADCTAGKKPAKH